MDKLPRVMDAIGYQFDDISLLELALTHRSKGSRNYERLEFLGDSILGFVVADWLLAKFTDLGEGKLSRMRSTIVRRETLARVARSLDFSNFLIMGEGELRSGGYNRESILADVVESIIGAIYLDSGMDEARDFILRHLQPHLESVDHTRVLKDPKSRLQEIMQKLGHRLPTYSIVETSGMHHEQQFTVECKLDELPYTAKATASSRRNAEQAAAKEILDQHFSST